MTHICIPIVEKNIDSLIRKINIAAQKADIVEIWLGELFPNSGDFKKYGEEYIQQIFKAKKQNNDIPLLFTVKDKKEQGCFEGTDQEKIQILQAVIEQGAEYIDIDYMFNEELLAILQKNIQSSKTSKLILSAHFFEGTPTFPSLKNRVQRMQNLGADIIKIAAMPQSNKDVISILRLAENLGRKEVPFIAISMGKKGKFSRVMCPLLGSYMAFGSLDKNSASAPGQMTAEEVKENFKNFS